MISIFILTLNEENNIEECLKSVAFSNDIVVLDSYSQDQTVQKAKALGASVYQRNFDNWASHQNWAMANISFKNNWVFYLDADERMTPQLKKELLAIAASKEINKKGYFVGRINYFMGKPITHCYPPVPIMRFFQPKFIRYERLVNPIAILEGQSGNLHNRFEHYNFSKGLTEWFDKHNKYSYAEAMEAIKVLDNPISFKSIFSRDKATQRVALKNISLKLPFRPFLKFIYLYLFKQGFLDGLPGLTYCFLQSIYEYQIDIKIWEQKRLKKKLPI
jgi:glycosyltransferase involved in cell wall biosynthesis